MILVIRRLCFSILFTLFISGCAGKSSIFSYSNNSQILHLGKDNQNQISIKFNNPEIKHHQSFQCNVNSYTLNENNYEYGKLFIEYINLGSSCHWNGLSSGFFESNLKSELKINTLEIVENFDISSYNFKTYRVNNDSYISIIYIYKRNVDRFILDYDGKLYTKLLKVFKPEYKNRIDFQKRFRGNYDSSLVRKNSINNYFEQERWTIRPRVGISIFL